MGPYRPLFGLTVEHEFFSSGLLPGLRLQPAGDSVALLAHPAFVLRRSARGLQVSGDTSRLQALTLLAEAHEGALAFSFTGYGGRPPPQDCSEPFLFSDTSTPTFNSGTAVREDSGVLRLHQGLFVSEQDMVPRDATVPVPPLLTVHLRYGPRPGQTLAQRLEDAPDEYCVRFAAQSTYWKYYLLGSLHTRRLSIVDLDGESRFEPLGETTLRDARPALVFRSTAPIALSQHSGCRFQLREQGSAGERVLFKRLPVARTGQVSRETIDGEALPVSEIYLNG